jgi:acyl-CoA thioesterase YciA
MNDILKLKRGELINRNSQFCLGKNIGIHTRMFGGDLLSQIDIDSSVFVAEICDTPWVVTKKLDVEFIKPILEGEIFKTYIGIQNIGRTSITLNIEIRTHSVQTEREEIAIRGNAVFVRINEYGESIPINDKVRKKFGYKKL